MTSRFSRAPLRITAGLVIAFSLIPIRAEDETQANFALFLADREKLIHKVDTLVIGDVDFKDVTIKQAAHFLHNQSVAFDPDHQGVNIFYSNENGSDLDSLRFSVKLKHATVSDVLQHFPMVRADYGDFVVELRRVGCEDAYSRTFIVPDNVLAINPSMLIDKKKQIYDVRPLFQAKGVKFPPAAQAVYSLPAKSLTVILVEPDEFLRVEELLIFGFKNVK
jgi:hypothetical protein